MINLKPVLFNPSTFFIIHVSLTLSFQALSAAAQPATVEVRPSERQQVIDGFGTHQGGTVVNQAWWQELYYDDLAASIYRVDLTPRFVSPYSDFSYYSPWFMGSGVRHPLNLEDPANPDGPEGNRVRTYTGPQDYSRSFGGYRAPIAVMGPDIDENVRYFTYPAEGAIMAGAARREQLGDFKLVGSFWSPAPWVKVSSGNRYPVNWWPGPVANTPWPFVWGGNFAGGRLDVSGTPLAVFDDSALGGSGPTSALTQFARGAAAYVRGYQQAYGVRLYAISIQNELNFEEFYNSATYPLSSQYLTAVKAVRSEFDKYPDLRDIRLMGPEDLLGGDAYGLWQYGSGNNTIHKNLQYLQNLAADPEAGAAVDFFCIHGYDANGASSAGADSRLWDWWANGWSPSPAPGIPANVKGFRAYDKKSWMTETSGEQPPWLAPAGVFPHNGAWSIALKIHQALTTGRQSAWLYWTFTESDDNGNVTSFALTNQAQGANAPKYVAAKHFFRYIRPGAYRVTAVVTGPADLEASAYLHDDNGTLTVVLINASPSPLATTISIPPATGASSFDGFTSQEGSYWQRSTIPVQNGAASVAVPGYGIVTLHAAGLTTAVERPSAQEGVAGVEVVPNPFHETTTFRFRLIRPGRVRLTVSDLAGRTVAVLVDEERLAGVQEVAFDGKRLADGVYLYRLEAGGKVAAGKIEVTR